MRRPLTTTPQVDRLSAGLLVESAGYRVVRPRGTTDWLLIHTRAGRGLLRLPGGVEVTADPSTATLISPGTPHDYGVDEELRHWDIAFSHFHPRPEWSVLLDWPQVAPGIGQVVLDEEVQQRTTPSWSAAALWCRSDRPRADLFAMNALELVLLLCDTQNPRAAPIDSRILRSLEHLDQNLARPLSVAEMAAAVHLSPSRFAHLFTAQVGTSPSRYLEGQRIARSRLLLEHTRRPVADVAREVGFSDPPYFSTRFRQLVGTTPLRYRREHAPPPPS
ncbi:AraC family transcriptional regulator [Auraticoccus monumenti]|uniref:AraC family transcriptional regulator, arabinose operon regulatory protein n=1 Tax=Auraticoccus monumenti TaxID=675864 RepID=A0A1G6Z5H1_9ACTN|nr:helix-turn-helix domain-containing protein [Auraticoccus monumenti]SDD97115.1 AraC family transcriptional regulator, arabinose operon regulatory protein [Auraticoccus monumenti]